jgi:hypothetical protein
MQADLNPGRRSPRRPEAEQDRLPSVHYPASGVFFPLIARTMRVRDVWAVAGRADSFVGGVGVRFRVHVDRYGLD